MVTNEEGLFTSFRKIDQAKVNIRAIGYQAQTFYLKSDIINLIKLKPIKDLLPEIIVSSKAKKTRNANAIINKVAQQFETNYGNFPFTQKIKFDTETYNYDTLKEKSEEVVEIQFNNKIMKSPNWLKDTLFQDASFSKFIGVPTLVAGDIIPWFDMLRKGFPIQEGKNKGLDFRLIAKYHDEQYGEVYRVSFKPNSHYEDAFLGRTVGGLSRGYLKGEIIIQEKDYAMVRMKFIWEMKVEALNKGTQNLFHTPTWKANRVTKIISDKIIFQNEYVYQKDKINNKYFIELIKADCFNTGYQIENRRPVQLHFRMKANNLGISKK